MRFTTRSGRTLVLKNPFPTGGRDPSRIPVVLEALRAVWESSPDLRLGQLIAAVSAGADPFQLEEDEWLRRLVAFARESKGS